MASRVLVKGEYLDSSTYILKYYDSGKIFQTIHEEKTFSINYKMSPWHPIKILKKFGKGTILICRMFGKFGNTLEEFTLYDNMIGLWALTPGAASHGVFINTYQPRNMLEEALALIGVPTLSVKVVDEIDQIIKVGDYPCNQNSGFLFYTDGDTEEISEPTLENSTHLKKVKGGTYLINTCISTKSDGCIREMPISIFTTNKVDLQELSNKVSSL